MRRRNFFGLACLLGIVCAQAGCSPEPGADARVSQLPARIKLAITTSLDNSGLLSDLLPAFEAAHNIKVDVISVGTGKALKLGERGDVDVLIVHAPEAEGAFLAGGHGVDRRYLMYNEFVLLGPPHNPAGVSEAEDVGSALRSIAHAKAPFVSRGDDSGTHKKERKLWRLAGAEPRGSWYIEAGQGMGATLTMADEKRAYVLSDRGTYLALRDKIELVVVFEGAPEFGNPYHIILVNPNHHPHVRFREAKAFADWLTSTEAQGLIGAFRRHGQVLFQPAAVAPNAGESAQ